MKASMGMRASVSPCQLDEVGVGVDEEVTEEREGGIGDDVASGVARIFGVPPNHH